jgi:uncharacterized protein YjbI with pentapeptide repeats
MLLFTSSDLATYLSLGIAALAIIASLVTTGLTLRHQRKLAEHQSFDERYASAAEQLGHEQAAVRLAGVHALVRLTDDWEPQRQAGIDVLCAYLRMPYDPESAPKGEKEVRQTIIRLIGNHLRLDTRVSWSEADLDFTGARFDGGDFHEAVFSGIKVSFQGATFSGGVVSFAGAMFSGEDVDFRESTFSGGQVNFDRAKFSGGQVYFDRAKFSGGQVYFADATFHRGVVRFDNATFSDGDVSFEGAWFGDGEVNFAGATFSGGKVNFFWTTFSDGHVDFRESTFSGGEVNFAHNLFSGGEVNFADVKQWTKPPTGLPSEAPGLHLPQVGNRP